MAYLKDCCNHSLRGNNGRENCHNQARIQHAGRNSIVEWIGVRIRMHADVCSLANVRQQEAGITVRQPTDLDSSHAEGTKVGEQGFYTSEGKKYTAEHPPSSRLLLDEEVDSEVRRESLQHRVIEHDQIVNAKTGIECEPQDHDGGEHGRELRGSERLHAEEDNQYSTRSTNDGRARDVRTHH